MSEVSKKSKGIKGILRKILIVGVIAFLVFGLVAVALIYTLQEETLRTGAISCDAPLCADIGKRILEKKGKIGDAAIATLICMGAIHSSSMGIGGGFLLVAYDAVSNESFVLNARESAPSAANSTMYGGNSSLSQKGPLSVAVPGEIKGYWELYHKMGGGVKWEELFEPTIELCEKGIPITGHTGRVLKQISDQILSEPTMAEIFVNKKTGKVWEEGDIILRHDLAKTLRAIAKSSLGGDEMYKGEIARLFVDDLEKMGGIITLEDMQNYKAEWTKPVQISLWGGLLLRSVPPPGAGILLAFITKLFSLFLERDGNYLGRERGEGNYTFDKLTVHRITEAFKFGYAKRTLLGDAADPEIKDQIQSYIEEWLKDKYLRETLAKINDTTTHNDPNYYGNIGVQPDDHGTAHLSIVTEDGSALSVTSTINLYYGAKIRSRSTGIIYNNEMDDFSSPNMSSWYGIPPSPANFIKPGKRPLSSMCPMIITDENGKVRLTLGSAGGTRITTTNALVTIRNLWFGETIEEAINAPRFHHQLFPMTFQFETPGFPKEMVNEMKKFGHETEEFPRGFSITCGIARLSNGSLQSNSDIRKGGSSLHWTRNP